MRSLFSSRSAIVALWMMLGAVFNQASVTAQVVILEDDFTDAAAGVMALPGAPPNTNPAWRWNEDSSTPNIYDGMSSLRMPIYTESPKLIAAPCRAGSDRPNAEAVVCFMTAYRPDGRKARHGPGAALTEPGRKADNLTWGPA